MFGDKRVEKKKTYTAFVLRLWLFWESSSRISNITLWRSLTLVLNSNLFKKQHHFHYSYFFQGPNMISKSPPKINLLFCPLEFRFRRGGGEDQVQNEGRIQFEATLMDGESQSLSSQKSAEVQLQSDGQPIHFDTDLAWTLTRTRCASSN